MLRPLPAYVRLALSIALSLSAAPLYAQEVLQLAAPPTVADPAAPAPAAPVLQVAPAPVTPAAPAPAMQPAPISPMADELPVLMPTALRLNNPARNIALRLNLELGTLGVLQHTVQFSTNGSALDYVNEGGQNNLFFFARISAELEIFRRHTFIFLYQPLDLRTEQVLSRDIVLDDLTFPSGTPMNFRYGFDFYRFNYQFDFLRSRRHELAIGLGIQIRNAAISFTSVDGTLRRVNNDIGVVPLLHLRARTTFKNGVFLGTEIDGIYARGRVITGSLYEFEGAILDASVRVGLSVTSFMETYLNLRYIGGGAQGYSPDDPPPGDGYTNNWLHTMIASIGFTLR